MEDATHQNIKPGDLLHVSFESRLNRLFLVLSMKDDHAYVMFTTFPGPRFIYGYYSIKALMQDVYGNYAKVINYHCDE